jgi:cytochrome c oxidase assembly protein subunit 11
MFWRFCGEDVVPGDLRDDGINILVLSANGLGDLYKLQPIPKWIVPGASLSVRCEDSRTWHFKPTQNAVQVHPGELMTVMYEFRTQNRTMSAHPKLCTRSGRCTFNNWNTSALNTLAPGEEAMARCFRD